MLDSGDSNLFQHSGSAQTIKIPDQKRVLIVAIRRLRIAELAPPWHVSTTFVVQGRIGGHDHSATVDPVAITAAHLLSANIEAAKAGERDIGFKIRLARPIRLRTLAFAHRHFSGRRSHAHDRGTQVRCSDRQAFEFRLAEGLREMTTDAQIGMTQFE